MDIPKKQVNYKIKKKDYVIIDNQENYPELQI